MPTLPFFIVLALRQQDVTGMPRRSHPCDQVDEVGFRHRRATGTRPRDAPTNMEKDRAAGAGLGRIGVVPNFHQPAIRKIVVPHFLFFEPGRRFRQDAQRSDPAGQ